MDKSVSDAWKPLFHELWGMHKEGEEYSSTAKDKWSTLLSILERMTKEIDGQSAR